MSSTYYTNFLTNAKTGAVIMAMDFENAADSIRAAILDHVEGEIHVERVGPLNKTSLFETSTDYDPIIDRVAY